MDVVTLVLVHESPASHFSRSYEIAAHPQGFIGLSLDMLELPSS